jgi:MFS family permease
MIDLRDQPALASAARFLDQYRRPLALVAGALGDAAYTLLHPLLVLPLVVAAVDGPAVAAGTLAAAAAIAWLLPQLIISRAGRRGWLLVALAGLAALMGVLAPPMSGNPATLLSTLLVLVAGFWATAGLLATGQPNELLHEVGEGEPANQAGILLGGALTVLAGLLLGRLLAPDGAGFPGWFTQVTLLVAVALALAAVAVWREEPTEGSAPPAPWTRLALAPALLAHGRRPRRYLAFRVVLGLALLADPLLLVYGVRSFDLPLQGAGFILALYSLVLLIGALVFPLLTAAGYTRLLTQGVALARVLLPLLALATPLILHSEPIASRLATDAAWLPPATFAGLAALFGLATAGLAAADAAYLRDAMSPRHRPAMRALLLVLLSLLSVAFVVGGAIADRWGVETVLLIATGLGLLAVLASGLLLEVPPVETRDLTDTGALPTFREQDWE